jgi:ribosomal protein S18 acetylase RimI-like enzyme
MQIRRLRSNEVELFRDLRLQALADSPTAFRETLAEAQAKPLEHWQTLVQSLTAGDQQVQFLAEVAEQVVGIVAGIRDRQLPYVTWVASLWVRADQRGQGIGSALLQQLRDWAIAHHKTHLRLRVTEQNKLAIALYQRAGFRFTGERVALPWNPELQVLSMQLDLTQTGAPK